MGPSFAGLLLYAAPFAVFLFLYFRRRGRHLRQHAAVLQESRESGLTDPVSLHPVIDPLRCIGSSSKNVAFSSTASRTGKPFSRMRQMRL